jgi:two-component sensor histidine kinase
MRDAVIEKSSLKAKIKKLRRKAVDADMKYAELSHRVKNELQLILSLFSSYQKGTVSAETYDQCILQLRNLIMMHQMLDEPKASIRMHDYIKDLSEIYRQSFDSSIDFTVDIETKITLHTRHARCVAQFFFEAAMNALKHGFPSDSSGTITTSLQRSGGKFEFIVANDGASFDPNAMKPDAFRAMRDIARQLAGEFHAEALPQGMLVRLIFKK